MRRFVILLCAALLMTSAAPGEAQNQLEMSPDEARLAAAGLLTSGQPQAAVDITSVLIRRDPEDGPSLIIHAQALRTLQRYDLAQQASRRAWAASEHPLDRYAAAIAMAQSLSSDGRKTRAQWWLRRAVEVAPNPRLKERAARDFAYLRRTNPWSVDFSFRITPSDNVNNAPRDNTYILGGYTYTTADPVSGFEIRSDIYLRYNFAEEATKRNFLALGWTENHVVFSEDDVPPELEASDFSYRKLETTIGRDFTSGPGKPRQTVSLSLGRVWSGGNTLADEVKLNWRQTYTRPKGRRFAWDASLGYSDRKDADIRSGFTSTLGAQWSRSLQNGGRLGWQAAVSRTDTDSSALTHTRLNFGVQYTHPKPIMGAIAQMGMSAELRRYDDPLINLPEARRDARATLSTSLLFVDFDTYGFAPKLTLEASRTDSNTPTFETQNLGLQIGFQSLF